MAFRDAASFRDPSGFVFEFEGRILRTVMPSAAQNYVRLRDSGLLELLVSKKLLISATELDPADVPLIAPRPSYLLEHPRLDFVSYPYEWSFSAHRSAALLHLDLHLLALEHGFTLSDASAYNVQFQGAEPIFIDTLSLRPYRPGELWVGHRQFCMQFLNPLVMSAKLGIDPQGYLRGQIEGIDPVDLALLLRFRHRLSWTLLTHIILQARFQSRGSLKRRNLIALREALLPESAFRQILLTLRGYISRLSYRRGQTVWADYTGNESYSQSELRRKRDFVAAVVKEIKPGKVIDIGCNSGAYAEIALDAGAGSVIGFDVDHGALEAAFARSRRGKLAFLPLWHDMANPSPDQGWSQKERKGFAARAKGDVLLALALVHHLAIGKNIPLEQVVDWLIDIAPQGIIEFIPKTDLMAQRLLALRDDIFSDYTEAVFLAAVTSRARVRRSERMSKSGRVLIWYERDSMGGNTRGTKQ
jgi:ribosomal protein L11 methylase PrmA